MKINRKYLIETINEVMKEYSVNQSQGVSVDAINDSKQLQIVLELVSNI